MNRGKSLTLGAAMSVSLGILLLGGCAFSYVDSEGSTHVIGLVKLKIELGNSQVQNFADGVEIQSLGISVYSTPVNSGISVGYNREQITAVRMDTPKRPAQREDIQPRKEY